MIQRLCERTDIFDGSSGGYYKLNSLWFVVEQVIMRKLLFVPFLFLFNFLFIPFDPEFFLNCSTPQRKPKRLHYGEQSLTAMLGINR